MYYSDNKYKNIPVPKKFQKDIALRVYNGSKFVLDNDKKLQAVKQDIICKIEKVSNSIIKNNSRYKYSDSYDEYEIKYSNELKELESQLKDL